MIREPNNRQKWTIFQSIHEAAKERESGRLKKLRLAKCSECGRVTPYRLKSLEEITLIRCRRCGTSIPVRAR